MLKALADWFSGFDGQLAQADNEAELHLAAAVLLFEVARSDQQLESVETERIEQFLRQYWTLDDSALAELIQVAGRESELNASIYSQVETINARFSPEEKYRLLKGLWRVAAADGSVHHHEEHLVRRIADLLYLPHSDFIRAKVEVLGD